MDILYLRKTTHKQSTHFIIRDNKVIYRSIEIPSVINIMIDIIMNNFSDRGPKHTFEYRIKLIKLIFKRLDENQCFVFLNYALITTAKAHPKILPYY